MRDLERAAELLASATRAIEDRDQAFRALRALGSAAVASLIQLLESPDAYIRQGAAFALGDVGDERAVDPLLRLFADEPAEPGLDYLPWFAAASALGELRATAAVEPLIEAMERASDTDEHLDYIPTALGMIGDRRALIPLRRVVARTDEPFSYQARAAIEQISFPEKP